MWEHITDEVGSFIQNLCAYMYTYIVLVELVYIVEEGNCPESSEEPNRVH